MAHAFDDKATIELFPVQTKLNFHHLQATASSFKFPVDYFLLFQSEVELQSALVELIRHIVFSLL